MNTMTLSHVASPEGHTFFEKTVAFIHNELAMRAAVRDLRQMDDRTLADIGICRSEIIDAVRGRRLVK